VGPCLPVGRGAVVAPFGVFLLRDVSLLLMPILLGIEPEDAVSVTMSAADLGRMLFCLGLVQQDH